MEDTVTIREHAPTRLKLAGRRAATTVGRRTSAVRMLPDFLVVGGQRCGTTSLHRALLTHPAIRPPLFHKGVHYFDVAYERGPDWYRGHFPVRALADKRVGRHGPARTFESSGYYMHHPLAPERISADLPGVRLVVMLRDPVERAYSAHRHELERGFETESFERALELERQRLAGEVERIRAEPGYVSHAHRHHSYVDRGRYAGQVSRLFGLFGRDRVHVLTSEDFFTRPEPVYDRLLEFLGLPIHHPPAFEQHNARRRAPMPEAVRDRLRAEFEPHDDALAGLLGEQPGWRR
jgi:hypothetical protein